jgi:hypothetical protein
MPLNAGAARIARVVLLSAAAGLALADGDAAAAAEFGTTADAEATELGVQREVPLIRAVLARALLARGDLAAAAGHAGAALSAALAMPIESPLAIGLETAALVLHTAGAGSAAALRDLLVIAAAVRDRGDRPPPAPLAPAVGQLRATLDGDTAGRGTPGRGTRTSQPRPRETAERACELLDGLTTARLRIAGR